MRFSKTRYWVINFVTYGVEDSKEIGPVIHRELMEENERKQRPLNSEMNEHEMRKFETRRNEFQSFVIQEEKATRKLFETIAKWAFKTKLFVRKKVMKRDNRRASQARVSQLTLTAGA